MNQNHSRDDYLPRWLGPTLARTCAAHPVVVLTGARQVGKSTTLRHEEPFRGWAYQTLDDMDTLSRAGRDPAALWHDADRVVIDEVQRAPGLLVAVKAAVDAAPARRFVLSGSANLLLMSHVAESLAGRAVYLEMLPMSLGEFTRAAPPTLLDDLLSGRFPPESTTLTPPDPIAWMLRGFMPALLRLNEPRDVVDWWDGYVATYLERDLRQLSQVESLPDFRRLMATLALRAGKLLNQSAVARDAGLSQPTAHRYTRLLQVSGLFHALPAFSRNRTRRLVKAPKALWTDPALATFLAGLYDVQTLREAREAGGLFECLVFLHLRGLAQQFSPRPGLFHWRDARGAEVDFVVEHGQRLLPVEAKLTTTPRYDDIRHLETFMAEHPAARAGLLVHAGGEVRRLTDRIVAVPWWMLGGFGG